jgi:hypothetical protein
MPAAISSSPNDQAAPPENPAPGAEPQRPVCHEPLAADAGEKENGRRFHVRVTSYRKRLLDPDNLCPKYFIDCLRYAGIIPDDSARFMDFTVRQQKVKGDDEERTEIEVEISENPLT